MTARAWAVFTILATLWGLPYFFMKIAVHELSPAFIAWSRITVGAALLLPWAWRRGALRGLGARRGAILAFAFFEVIAPYFLIALGERWISSSLAAILIATVPLGVVLLSPWFGRAGWPAPRRWVGLGLGLTGVVALLGIDVAGRPLEILGAACVLVSAVGYAIGPLVVQRHLTGVDPLGPVAAALGIGALVLAVPAALTAPTAMPSLAAIASLLGLAGSAMAVVLFLFLIAEVGAARASVVAYVNPAVAVLVGIVALGERPGAVSIAGLVLILVGSGLATARDRVTATNAELAQSLSLDPGDEQAAG